MNIRKTIMLALMTAAAATAWAGRPQVVAHRGHWQPEGSAQNSIRALIKADSIGADAVELDVWISADDVLYVNHDPDFNGVTIEKADSKTLSKLRLTNCEPLPTLESYLEAARTLKPDLVVEMKTHTDPQREDVAVAKVI